MTILVTGFDAFDSRETNASWETASALPSSVLSSSGENVRITVKKLPVVYYKCVIDVLKALDEDDSITDIILLGEAGGRARVSVEQIAVNVDDAPIPDNEENLRQGEPIDPEGPDGIFATIPVRGLVEHLTTRDEVPIYASWSAGQYVCNHVLYGVLNALLCREPKRKIRVGFVHLPFTSQQASLTGMPGLPLTELARSVKAILQYLANNPSI